MNESFSEYVNCADSEIIKFLSSNDVKEDEKVSCIESYIDSISKETFKTSSFTSTKYIISLNSSRFIDSELIAIKNKRRLSNDDIEAVDKLCSRQKSNIAYLTTAGVSGMNLKINDLDLFNTMIKKRYKTQLLYDSIFDLDKKANELVDGCIKKHVEPFEEVYLSINALEDKIKESQKAGVVFAGYNGEYIKKLRLKVDNYKLKLSNESYYKTVVNIDKEITDLMKRLRSLSEDDIAAFYSILSVYDSQLVECQKRKINISSLVNKDTKAIRDNLEEQKNRVNDRKDVNQRIGKCDAFIRTYDNSNVNADVIDELIKNCEELNKLLIKCNKNKWKVSNLYCEDPVGSQKKFCCYQQMFQLDNKLAALLVEEKPYSNDLLYQLCEQQEDNIKLCHINVWEIPLLNVKNPNEVKLRNKKRANREKWFVNAKKTVTIGIVVAALITIIIGGSILVYNSNHTRFPFEITYVIGDSYEDVIETLEEAGYTNVDAVPSTMGISAPGLVLTVQMDGVESIEQGRNYRNESDITVYYSSMNRIDVSKTLANWNQRDYESVCADLEQLGFEVRLAETYSNSVSNNNKIQDMVLNGIQYGGGDCYIPRDATIVIYRYGQAVRTYDNSEDIIGENYIQTYEALRNVGFDNITFIRDNDLITGWLVDDGSISDITINGSSFEVNDEYYHGDEVIIHVHTFSSGTYELID